MKNNKVLNDKALNQVIGGTSEPSGKDVYEAEILNDPTPVQKRRPGSAGLGCTSAHNPLIPEE